MILACLRRWQGDHLGVQCVVSKTKWKELVGPLSNPIHQRGKGAYKEVISLADQFQNYPYPDVENWDEDSMWEILHPDKINAVSCTIIMTLLDRPNKTLFRRAMLCRQMTQPGKRNQRIFCRKYWDDFWNNYLLHLITSSSSPRSLLSNTLLPVFGLSLHTVTDMCRTELPLLWSKMTSKDTITIKSNDNKQTYPIAARICSSKSNSCSRCGVQFPRIISRQLCTVSCAWTD